MSGTYFYELEINYQCPLCGAWNKQLAGVEMRTNELKEASLAAQNIPKQCAGCKNLIPENALTKVGVRPLTEDQFRKLRLPHRTDH